MQHMVTFEEDAEESFFVRFGGLAILDRGHEKPLHLSRESDSDFDVIERGQVEGQVAVQITQIPLRRVRLGDFSFAYGEGKVGSRPALAVVTREKLSVRVRPDPDSS
jgi:hypothetical protein